MPARPASPDRAVLVLPDGRSLGYLEVGDPDGVVVLHHHGGLMSAGDIVPLAPAAESLGIRLIAADRPGVGGSTLVTGRTLRDGAADARSLMDHLGVSECRVLGWSMGGPYALATAAALAGRVPRVAIVAGALPLDDPERLAELNAMDRRFTALAEDHPAALRHAASALGGLARFSPGLWARSAAKGEGVADEQALRGAAHEMAAAAADGLADPAGIVEEYRAWARPWGFGLDEVVPPTDVWIGTEDHLVPPSWAQVLAQALPNATLHEVAGEGHFLLLNRGAEVLGTLVR
jgi:pimeloyl-ACP methyl ester carboxylesterase